jgi:hypothetical protein
MMGGSFTLVAGASPAGASSGPIKAFKVKFTRCPSATSTTNNPHDTVHIAGHVTPVPSRKKFYIQVNWEEPGIEVPRKLKWGKNGTFKSSFTNIFTGFGEKTCSWKGMFG